MAALDNRLIELSKPALENGTAVDFSTRDLAELRAVPGVSEWFGYRTLFAHHDGQPFPGAGRREPFSISSAVDVPSSGRRPWGV